MTRLEGEPQDCIGGLMATDMDVHGAQGTEVKNSAQGKEVDKGHLGHDFVLFGPS